MKAEPLGRRPRKTRREIYNAAISLFQEHGVQSVTMQDIAERAETARSTVFNHYPNKDSLLREFYTKFAGSLIENAAARKCDGFQESMSAFFKVLGEECEKYPLILKEVAPMALGAGALADAETKIDTQMIDFLTGLVKEGVRSGEVCVSYKPQDVSKLLLALITATNHDWVNQGQASNLAEDHQRRFAMLLNGLKP